MSHEPGRAVRSEGLAPVTPIRAGVWEPPIPGSVEPGRASAHPDGDELESRPLFAEIEEASLKALGRRSLSRRELERALSRQGYAEHDIDDELDRLERVGLVDDYALAQRLIAQLQERKGLVGSAIKAELVRRVIHPGAIAYAMDLVDTGDELAKARELASVRARQYGRLDHATIERRLTAWLMRRGFSSSTVRAAVASAVAELRTA